MTLATRDIRSLTVELAAADARDRDLAASKVSDMISESLDGELAGSLARVLEVVMALEEDETALNSQLNALSELSSFGLVPRDVIARVVASRDWGFRWATDFIEGLTDDLPYAPE
ncbi:hypothetical protein [Luteimicrobium subarcticum]|uniref:Uncharacterized protein n=1 Tax=Luteimicrobium subarcticum TaxID=620910 RepID=A0A2M8WJ20_9MICO|nr:hypothetical protein [Luteimicrobium subarcticum]PJI90930.1 hypothetical protein CLV34_2187 [Luteimicrobium subarcticum]